MLLNLVVQRKSRRRASPNTKPCFTSTSKPGKTSLRLSISRRVLFRIGSQLKRLRSALLGGTVDRRRGAFAVRTSFLVDTSGYLHLCHILEVCYFLTRGFSAYFFLPWAAWLASSTILAFGLGQRYLGEPIILSFSNITVSLRRWSKPIIFLCSWLCFHIVHTPLCSRRDQSEMIDCSRFQAFYKPNRFHHIESSTVPWSCSQNSAHFFHDPKPLMHHIAAPRHVLKIFSNDSTEAPICQARN